MHHSRTFRRTAATVTFVFVAAAGAMVASSCGSASAGAKASNRTTTTTPSAQQHRVAAIKYARCMRAHGVNVLDPDQNGDIRVDAPSTPPSVITAAQKACHKYAAALGRVSVTAQLHAELLAHMTRFTHCMRQHGIPMADPITKGPHSGVGYRVPPGIDPNSPRYTSAENACKHFLRIPNG